MRRRAVNTAFTRNTNAAADHATLSANRNQHGHNAAELHIGHATCICAALVVVFAAMLWRVYWLPQPLPLSASVALFSEGRAMLHVQELAGQLGERLVSTDSIDMAAECLLKTAQDLAQHAAHRTDLIVQVQQEQVSGEVHMSLLGARFGNMYQNLTNILLTIMPKAAAAVPAVLVNAHYDTAIGSPGASDCASPIGVMLEAARVLIANPEIQLAGPVFFLFNGAEETLSQAAHGFMLHSQYAKQVGAFINLESTGPGGPDLVFQASGGWTTQVYAQAAPHARGQVFGQDLMDAQIIPADTDFRMFSYKYYGSLPGVDVAFLLDSSAYHTHEDAPHRIRPGTLQAMGENVVAAIPAFAKHLSQASAGELNPSPLKDPPGQEGTYFDLCGIWMVSYPVALGRWLHNFILPLVLLMPPAGVRRGRMVKGAGLCLLSLLCGLAVPAGLGALRAVLSGQPLVWFSNHAAACFIYIPAAAAGLLLPYCLAHTLGLSINCQVAGVCLLEATLAAAVTLVGGKVAYSHALRAYAAYSSLWLVNKVDSTSGLAAAISCAVVPAATVLCGLLLLMTHLMEKISMTGAPPPHLRWGPDAIIGALLGASAFFTAGHLTAWIAHCLKPHFKRVLLGLMLVSFMAASVASLTLNTYDSRHLKRVFLQHLIRDSPSGQQSLYAAASSDATDVSITLQRLNLTLVEPDGKEWLAMFPMHDMIRGQVYEAPLADPSLMQQPPHIEITAVHDLGILKQAHRAVQSHDGTPSIPELLHLDVELKLPRPAVGVLNVTGPLHAWIKGPFRNHTQEGQQEYVARFGGNKGSEVWPLSFVAAKGEAITISWAVAFLGQTAALQGFTQQMPDWVATSGMTTFQSSWTWPG